MPKKMEEEVPGSGKAQCSSVGEYQDREMGRGWLGNRGREEGLGTMDELGYLKEGLEMKNYRVQEKDKAKTKVLIKVHSLIFSPVFI